MEKQGNWFKSVSTPEYCVCTAAKIQRRKVWRQTVCFEVLYNSANILNAKLGFFEVVKPLEQIEQNQKNTTMALTFQRWESCRFSGAINEFCQEQLDCIAWRETMPMRIYRLTTISNGRSSLSTTDRLLESLLARIVALRLTRDPWWLGREREREIEREGGISFVY